MATNGYKLVDGDRAIIFKAAVINRDIVAVKNVDSSLSEIPTR